MEWYTAGIIILGIFVLFLALGWPIAFAFFIVAGGGLFLVKGPAASTIILSLFYEQMNHFTLLAVPLFMHPINQF